MSTPLNEIYQFEKHIEDGIKTMLTGACANIYKSRETVDLESERIELKAIIGENSQHEKQLSDGSFVFDAWAATLEMTVATNRSEAEAEDTHSALLGEVRNRITHRYTNANFESDVIVIIDVRDSGTVDSFRDANNIDITTMSFYIAFNVKPDAWPEI